MSAKLTSAEEKIEELATAISDYHGDKSTTVPALLSSNTVVLVV